MKKTKVTLLLMLIAISMYITYEIIKNNGSPLSFDITVQNMFLSGRNPILNILMTTITHMSDTWFIVGFCLILVILPSRRNYGVPITVACLMGLSIYKPLKNILMRSRPDKIYHLVSQGGFSFPSGHSVTSVIFYGTMIMLIERNVNNLKIKRALQGGCIILATLIGPSRIYVGVHWPTDVLCGWFIGGIILIIVSELIKLYFQRISG